MAQIGGAAAVAKRAPPLLPTKSCLGSTSALIILGNCSSVLGGVALAAHGRTALLKFRQEAGHRVPRRGAQGARLGQLKLPGALKCPGAQSAQYRGKKTRRFRARASRCPRRATACVAD